MKTRPRRPDCVTNFENYTRITSLYAFRVIFKSSNAQRSRVATCLHALAGRTNCHGCSGSSQPRVMITSRSFKKKIYLDVLILKILKLLQKSLWHTSYMHGLRRSSDWPGDHRDANCQPVFPLLIFVLSVCVSHCLSINSFISFPLII